MDIGQAVSSLCPGRVLLKIFPFYRFGNRGLREVKQLAPGHTANKPGSTAPSVVSWNPNSSSLVTQSLPSATTTTTLFSLASLPPTTSVTWEQSGLPSPPGAADVRRSRSCLRDSEPAAGHALPIALGKSLVITPAQSAAPPPALPPAKALDPRPVTAPARLCYNSSLYPAVH